MHDGRMQSQTTQSVLAGYRFSTKQIDVCLQATSLLARNFNGIFKHAWNNRFDFVVILHADIGVRPPANSVSWVDVLVDLVKHTGAAAISSVVPIKTEAGVTSTGLDLVPGNPYSMRRLTVRECNFHLRYPQIISKKDICQLWGLDPANTGPLLINTAVMCMNLRHYNWAKAGWPGFGIKDVIGWSKDGYADMFTGPEDWECSRWMDSMNWPYYATMKLGVDHFGTHAFSNRGAWGLLHDLTPVQGSLTDFRNSYVNDPRNLDQAFRRVRVPMDRGARTAEVPLQRFGNGTDSQDASSAEGLPFDQTLPIAVV